MTPTAGLLFCVLISTYTLERSEVVPVTDKPVHLVAGKYEADFEPFYEGNTLKLRLTTKKTGIMNLNRSDRFDPSTDALLTLGESFLCGPDPVALARPETLPQLARVYGPKNATDDSEKNIVVDASTALVAVHPTYEFDHGKDARQPTRDVLDLVKRSMPGAKTVLLSHIAETDRGYYLTRSDVDLYVHSESGAHRLRFPLARTVILIGGYIGACFCEGLRDVIAAIKDLAEPPRLVVAMEATFYPSLAWSGPESILSSFSNNVFGQSEQRTIPGGYLCPEQNSQRPIYKSLRTDGLRFVLKAHTSSGPYANGGTLGSVGLGPKEIELHFVSLERLPLYLPQAGP